MCYFEVNIEFGNINVFERIKSNICDYLFICLVWFV